MTLKQKTGLAGFVLVLGLVVAAVASMLSTTNCGGNSYALSACGEFVVAASLAMNDNSNVFEVRKLETRHLPSFRRDAWGTFRSDFLVRTNFARGNLTNRQIVIVCSRPFGNVPQPKIWNFFRRNPAHAVGYSDGTIGLIKPEEFLGLNLDGFVTADNLVTGSEMNASK
jgi:hypothetical protein